MKAKWAYIIITSSMFSLVAGHVNAQVAGSQTIGISVEEDQLIVSGWSAKKALLGKPVYNDQGQKIGLLYDIIIAPDKSVSFAIIAAHQFLGVSEHNVAVPIDQLDFVDGKLVLTGATRDALKSTPNFQYTKVKTVPVARADFGKH